MNRLVTLKKRPEFLTCAASSFKWVRPSFVLQLKPDVAVPDQRNAAHVGYTVTKKQGNAVVRNRIKRRLREAAQNSLTDHLRPHYNYVLIGRAAAQEIPFEVLKAELIEAATKLHRIVDKKLTEKRKKAQLSNLEDSTEPLKIVIGGHRGNGESDRANLPEAQKAKTAENTLPSIKEAIIAGATLIEVDAVLTADGQAVITHSNDLQQHILAPKEYTKLATNKFHVSDYSLAELSQLRVGIRGDGIMPSLRDVLLFLQAPEYKAVRLNIELKGQQGAESASTPLESPRLVEATLNAIKDTAFPEAHILLSSFDTAKLREARDRAPEIKRAMLFTTAHDINSGKAIFRHAVFKDQNNEDSHYEVMTPDRLRKLHGELALFAAHPEITSLNEANMQTAAALGIAVNAWSLKEPSPTEDAGKRAIQNALTLAQKHQIPFGIITNFVKEVHILASKP